MNNVKIEDIQKINKNIFFDFIKFCDENKIRYFAIGGTLLGAVRHKGFIPWDDDVDVGLLREDYDRFVKLSKNLPNNYLVESPEVNANSRCFFLKIYDKNTTAVEEVAKPVVRGLWIDVFPLDKTFNSKNLRGIHFLTVRFFARLFAIKNGNYSSFSKSKLKFTIMKIFEIFLYLIPHALVNKAYEKVLKFKNNDENSKYVSNFLGRWGKREIVPIEFFSENVTLNFEDIEVSVPVKYACYLKAIYGEYMVLPAEKDRVGHSLKGLNLKKGWLE